MPKGTCSIAGCTRPKWARGWCGTHYRRWQRHGDPLGGREQPRGRSPEQRFWEKVDKNGPPPASRPDLSPCWQWIGGKVGTGYGQIGAGGRGGHKIPAHRFAYELLVGPIPEGLQIDHLCRNRACVNPAHLEPVTQRENLLRGEGRTALNAAKTHCPYGHPYDEANTSVRTARNQRECRTCQRERTRERYHKMKET